MLARKICYRTDKIAIGPEVGALVRNPLLVEVGTTAVHQAIARSARSGLRRKPDISAV